MIDIIDRAIENANNGITKLSDQIFALEGYSGRKGRIFLNELCAHIPNLHYLEVGSWKGSTMVSSAFQNRGKFIAVDNFSQFKGSENILRETLSNFDLRDVQIIPFDFYQAIERVPYNSINVYFYDGAHGYEDHKKAITKAVHRLTQQAVIIIDDWNGDNAQQGTWDGIKESKLIMRNMREVGKNNDSDYNGWWNGLGIFVVER